MDCIRKNWKFLPRALKIVAVHPLSPMGSTLLIVHQERYIYIYFPAGTRRGHFIDQITNEPLDRCYTSYHGGRRKISGIELISFTVEVIWKVDRINTLVTGLASFAIESIL
jgi:hypothetical protein